MMMVKSTLAIIDDDRDFRESMRHALRKDYEVRPLPTVHEAETIVSSPPDVILLDLRLSESDEQNQEGYRLLQHFTQHIPHVPVLMITAYGDVETAVECMRLGAFDFIQKPRATLSEIKARLSHALNHARLSRKLESLEQELQLVEPRKIIGQTDRIQEIKKNIKMAAEDGNITVLILGQTGTGKELVARAIHASGWRSDRSFIPVSISAIPDNIVESELFGHEAGAFTDARKQKIGYIEKAHGGVLFLDEIGELNQDTQIKLLRFLEEKEFCRLGSTKPISVDVQIITATNAVLEELIQQKKFREDLFYRLKVFEIRLPLLRERKDDIPLLVEHFLDHMAQRGRKTEGISDNALQMLLEYPWPGNVRQLRNVLESALFQSRIHNHAIIDADDLPAEVVSPETVTITKQVSTTTPGNEFNLTEALAEDELRYIQQALEEAGGKKTEAWKLLGLNDRFALRRRVKTIAQKHPHLINRFPVVKKSYERNNDS